MTLTSRQSSLSENNGIKYLVGLLAKVNDGEDLIRVESALTLASATLS